MHLPRKIAGLLMAAGMVAGMTAAAAPAHAATDFFYIAFIPPGSNNVLMCLEGDPAPDFAYRVTTQPCNVANNQAQHWTEVSSSGGSIKLVNNAINWCMEANRITDGSPIPLWPCTSTESNLNWVWTATGTAFAAGHFESRISGSTGHCLTVPGAQALQGLWMTLSACDGSSSQLLYSVHVSA
jgi:hypothetical protein